MNRILLLLCVLCFIKCSSPVDPQKNEINKDIIELKKPGLDNFGNDHIYGKIAIYRNGNIYTGNIPGASLNKVQLDQNNNVLEYSELNLGYGNWSYIDGNQDGTKLLLIHTILGGISAGSLFEFNTVTHELLQLVDSTNYVSSARYMNGDDTKLIYYKYGKINYVNEFIDLDYSDAGYYELDLITKNEKLILKYVSGPGIFEMINSFDIHPANTKLLICFTKGSKFEFNPPFIGVYDILTQKLDTLNISFEKTNRRMNLWLRYNKNATKILYSYFPHGSYSHITNGTSEAGIIDVETLNRKHLDLNTNEGGSVQLSVEWDDYEQRIVFCSGRVNNEGVLGYSKLYILKQIP